RAHPPLLPGEHGTRADRQARHRQGLGPGQRRGTAHLPPGAALPAREALGQPGAATVSQDPDAHFAAQRPARVRVQAPADAAVDLQVPSAEHSAENFYVRQLIRSQLRLAVSVASGIIVLLVGITVLLSYWPQISQITLARIP